MAMMPGRRHLGARDGAVGSERSFRDISLLHIYGFRSVAGNTPSVALVPP